MNVIAAETRQSNPFATRWVRPGAVPYIFPPQTGAALVCEKLCAAGWRGAIVGPHGSGKSTLLATLIPMIEEQGVAVRLISLHDGQKKLPADCLPKIQGQAAIWLEQPRMSPEYSQPAALVVIEGYEQLGWWARRRLAAACRRRRLGLLVTVHREPRERDLPIIWRTTADLATVHFLVDHALPAHGGMVQNDDVAAAFHQHGGNVRETLFALYDLFEQRRRAGG